MIPENIIEISNKIEEHILYKKDNQNHIIKYCLDKNYPLNERWEIYKKYVIKVKESSIMCSDDFKSPILKYITEEIIKSRPDRKTIVNYDWFTDRSVDIEYDFKYSNRNPNIPNISIENLNTKNYIKYLVMEDIMIENFGSYEFDW